MNWVTDLREKIFGEAKDAAAESLQEKLIIIFFSVLTGIFVGLFLLFVWTWIYPNLLIFNQAKQQIETHLREAIKAHNESDKPIIVPFITREQESNQPTYQRQKIKPFEAILESERYREKDESSTENDTDADSENDIPTSENKEEEKKIF